MDLSTGAIVQLDSGGPPMQAAFLDYLRRWHALDPRRRHLLARLGDVVGRWWHCNDVFDDDFARRNNFYRHFLPAHDTRHLATAMIDSSPTTVSAFALELPAARGPLLNDERELARRLGLHAAEALRAQDRVRRMAVQALAGHRLLGALPYPMWLLDGDRFVLHANPAADEEDQREAHAARRDGRPVVLATLFDPARLGRLDAQALADSFGLTPTQARVAVLLAEGLTAEQIGAQLGVALSTIRTHLRSVRRRLGAARTADAVRLLREGQSLWAHSGA